MRGNHSQSQKKVYDTLGGREERTGLLPNSYNIALLSASSNMNRNVVYTELVSFLAKASADLNQQQNLKRKNCLVILNDSLLKMSIMSDSELKQSLYPERLWDWYKKTFDQIKSFGVKIVKRLRSSQSEEFLVRKSFVTDPCRELQNYLRKQFPVFEGEQKPSVLPKDSEGVKFLLTNNYKRNVCRLRDCKEQENESLFNQQMNMRRSKYRQLNTKMLRGGRVATEFFSYQNKEIKGKLEHVDGTFAMTLNKFGKQRSQVLSQFNRQKYRQGYRQGQRELQSFHKKMPSEFIEGEKENFALPSIDGLTLMSHP